MRSLRIGSWYEMPASDYDQPPLFTWRDFYSFRNHVIRLLRVFGTAGPMGEVDFSADEEDQPAFHSDVIDDPDFFVVDDMYNEHDRVSRVECSPSHLDAVLIESLAAMMGNFPDWHVSFGLKDSVVLVSADAVLVGGRRFWDCTSVIEIGDRCRKAVDFGAAEALPDSMNQLWRDIIAGGIGPTTQFAATESRQWIEVIRSLEALRLKRSDGCLSRFTYDNVRFDLHPLTRLELLRRILPELSNFSREQLAAMKRNLQKDMGQALTDAVSPEDASVLVMEIGLGVERVQESLDPGEIVNWWADLLHDFVESSPLLRDAISDGLRHWALQSDELLQLSALFGLARLGANDISSLVEETMKNRPEWQSNPYLIRWLQKLATKGRSYPDRKMLNKS